MKNNNYFREFNLKHKPSRCTGQAGGRVKNIESIPQNKPLRIMEKPRNFWKLFLIAILFY